MSVLLHGSIPHPHPARVRCTTDRCRIATPRAKTIAVSASNQVSALRATAEEMTIAAFRHPFGAGKVTFPGSLRAFWLAIRINVQNEIGDLAPIGSLSVGVKETQVRHKMLLIVTGQCRSGRSGIRYRRIERRLHVGWLNQSLLCIIAYHLAPSEARRKRPASEELQSAQAGFAKNYGRSRQFAYARHLESRISLVL